MEFLKDLVTLFNDDVNLRNWLECLMTNKIDIWCSHSLNIPDDTEPCGNYLGLGSNEAKKGITIRKSTIWAKAIEWVGEGDKSIHPSSKSTKVDVSALMIPLAYPESDLDTLLQEWGDNKWSVLHACGCGCLDIDSCCVPSHLYLGDSENNRDDRAYHKILKELNDIKDYFSVVEVLRKVNKYSF